MSVLSTIQYGVQAVRWTFAGKSVYQMEPLWKNHKAEYPKQDYLSNIENGYRKNEVIFACLSLKADSASATQLKIRDKVRQEDVLYSPVMSLLTDPNPYMSLFDFISCTLIILDLAGVCYWEKIRNAYGMPVQLYPLRPDWVKCKVEKGIPSYSYNVPGKDPEPLPYEDLVIFRIFDPLNQYGGCAPVSVASRVGSVDNATTDYLKLFFQEGGMPPGVLTTKQKLGPTDVDRIRANWKKRYGGINKWLEPAVLDMDATYTKLGLTFKEMGFDELDGRSESRIAQVLRVPPILISAKIGLDRSTFSNYAEARKAFWQDTLVPIYKRLRDTLQKQLVEADFGFGLELYWDYSEVPALQEDANLRWTRATTAWEKGAITRNEFYEEVGLAQRPTGDVYLVGGKLMPAGQIVTEVVSEPSDTGDSEGTGASDEVDMMEGEEVAPKDTEKTYKRYKTGKLDEEPVSRSKRERNFERALTDLLEEQLEEIGELV